MANRGVVKNVAMPAFLRPDSQKGGIDILEPLLPREDYVSKDGTPFEKFLWGADFEKYMPQKDMYVIGLKGHQTPVVGHTRRNTLNVCDPPSCHSQCKLSALCAPKCRKSKVCLLTERTPKLMAQATAIEG